MRPESSRTDPPTPGPLLAALASAGVCAALVGCSAWPSTSDADPVQPQDFVADAPQPDGPAVSASPGDDATPTDTAAQPTQEPAPAGERALAVDAMIGHVNGDAIYAQVILDPIDAELAAFGRRYDGDEFLQRAAPVIAGRLKEVLIDKLILAEAGGGLTERERMGVAGLVQQRREELLRYYGQGSLARARAEFFKAEEIELDEALAQYREELIVRRYLQQELMPQVNVQQRDVERLYHDLVERGVYSSEDRRTVRLMMTRDADAAGQIASRLASGEGFDEVAADDTLNQYNPAAGGQFNSGEPIEGDQVFGIAAVNDAILALDAGDHAGPIVEGDRHFFVWVESFEPGTRVELRDVQVELERTLQLEQWDALFRKFREDLWDAGGYTDPVQMTEKLLDIAIARYDSAG